MKLSKLMAALTVAFLLAVTLGTPTQARNHYQTSTRYENGCAQDNSGHTVCIGAVNKTYAYGYALQTAEELQRPVRRHRERTTPHPTMDADGNKTKTYSDAIGPNRHGMVEVKTVQGINIEVNPQDATKFLTFFVCLKDSGYRVPEHMVGCYSPGHKPGSNHRIGRACDIQTGWNRGPSFVYHMDKCVKAAGLYNGCSFGDCGHVEAVRGLYNPRPNLAMAMMKFHGEIAERQDEAKAFAEHAAFVLPERRKEEKNLSAKIESKKKRIASRSHKRRYAHHARRLAVAG